MNNAQDYLIGQIDLTISQLQKMKSHIKLSCDMDFINKFSVYSEYSTLDQLPVSKRLKELIFYQVNKNKILKSNNYSEVKISDIKHINISGVETYSNIGEKTVNQMHVIINYFKNK